VKYVRISPDSRLLASASFDKTIKVWNIATMTVRCTLQGHEDWVNSAVFSPDSKVIATISNDQTVKIWDPETGNLEKTLEGSGPMASVAFSRSGHLLASTCHDCTIKIWETANWDLMKSIHCDKILWRLSFDQTGMYLVTEEGRFQISDGSRIPEVEPLRSQVVREIGWGLDRDQSWVTWNSNNVLWIPPDYRVSSYYSDGTQLIESPTVTMIANGTDAGRVVVIEVPKSGPFD
jgi:WD40 repeat protein